MKSVPSDRYGSQYYRLVAGGDAFFKGKIDGRFYEALELADIKNEMSVLDIGTGRGEMAVLCAKSGANVFAIDYSSDSIKIAKKFISKNLSQVDVKKVSLMTMNAKELKFKDESFDRIMFLETLEHLYPQEAEKVLSEIKRVLKPGGKLVLSTGPNAFLIKPLLFLGTLVTGKKTWESRKYHVNEQNFFSLRKLLAKYGFSASIKIGHSKNWLYSQICDQNISRWIKNFVQKINKIWDSNFFYTIRKLPVIDIILGTHFLCLCIKQKG